MIILNLKEIQFMLTVLSLTVDLRRILEALVSAPKKVVPDSIAEDLRDLCTDRLDTHGLDEDYNPTEEGRKLDSLIDKLFTG